MSKMKNLLRIIVMAGCAASLLGVPADGAPAAVREGRAVEGLPTA